MSNKAVVEALFEALRYDKINHHVSASCKHIYKLHQQRPMYVSKTCICDEDMLID